MIASKLRAYEKAVARREARFRASTKVTGDTATRKVRLDEARILISEIEEFHQTHGLRKFLEDIGKPTSSAEIPDLDDFAANLDEKMMNDAILSHNFETEKTAEAAKELREALEDQNALDEFDNLLPIDRFDLMIRVAELLPIMHADGQLPLYGSPSASDLSFHAGGFFFDPQRISDVVEDLPLKMTNDGFELDTNAPKAREQIEAFGARHGLGVKGPNADAAIEVALSKIASNGQKFLGIFLGPTMKAINDANADTALGKALRAFLPPEIVAPSGQALTVDQIAQRLAAPGTRDQFNGLGSMRLLGSKVEFFLGVLDIGSELQDLAGRSSFDSETFRTAATAALKSADAVIAAAEQMGYKLSKRGIRTTGLLVTTPLLLLDGIATWNAFGREQRKGDLSVAMGEAVAFAGSAIMTVTATWVAATGGVVLSGPAGWAMAVGFALVLLGEFLINFTGDVALTTFSKTCVFTNNTSATLTSDDPADIQFRFADGDRFDARRQAEKLAAILHDPGFTASVPVRVFPDRIEVGYTHEVEVRTDDDGTETVPTVPDGVELQLHYIGKAGDTTAPKSVRGFSSSTMKQNGSLIVELDEDDHDDWRGGFFEFLIDLSPALPIRAYAEVP